MPGKVRTEIQLDGETYFASPLDDKDIQELDLFVQQQFMKSVYATMPEGLAGEDKDRAVALAQVTCSRMTFMSGEGARIIATVPGMTRLTWQMLHHNHPDLTVTELYAKLMNPKNIDEVNEKFREVNHLPTKKPKRNQHQPKSPKKRKKNRRSRT